jgi:hypothetical protein
MCVGSCMADLELRKSRRYPLVAPVAFWWPTSQGWFRAGLGTTRDICSDGVMVTARECPPVGVHIHLTVSFPRREGSGHAVKLHGEGVVVRVQSYESMPLSERTSGFAASVQFNPEVPNASEELGRDRRRRHGDVEGGADG